MWLYRFYFPLLIRLANDVETNPGPLFFVESSEIVKSNHVSSEINQTCNSPSMSMLAFRLAQLGLRPLDVGGAGDCFLEQFHISYTALQLITRKSAQLVLSI